MDFWEFLRTTLHPEQAIICRLWYDPWIIKSVLGEIRHIWGVYSDDGGNLNFFTHTYLLLHSNPSSDHYNQMV